MEGFLVSGFLVSGFAGPGLCFCCFVVQRFKGSKVQGFKGSSVKRFKCNTPKGCSKPGNWVLTEYVFLQRSQKIMIFGLDYVFILGFGAPRIRFSGWLLP
jgi:hypothetical protein